MSKPGQNNYKGINAQGIAALSLFLQNIKQSDFKEMILEGENLEDFVLVYNSGKKIICESKYRASGVGLYELKSIIVTVLKNGQIGDSDELLIISNNFHDKVKSLVDHFLFWTPSDLQEIKISSPNFSDNEIALIPQIRLWEVSDEINREGILFHMYQCLGSKNPFWIDKSFLEDWTNTLLVEGIYHKSESGEIISKADFLDQVERKKNHFLENNGTDFHEIREISLKRIESIVCLVEENNPSKRAVCANAITELIANPSIHFETLRRLGQSTDLNLSLWDVLWTASVSGVYSFEIFKILKNNLDSEENRSYAINFINKIIKDHLINNYHEDFHKKDIVEICEKVFEKNPYSSSEVLEIVKKLFEYSSRIFYYEEKEYSSRSTWGREQIAEFLNSLYQSDKTQPETREEIVDYILSSFNLVEDDGKFWNFTPPALFSIVRNYVNESPIDRIKYISKIASDQYQRFLRKFSKNIKFNGWEQIGGGITQSGNEFSIDERHFITTILQPVLDLLPNDDKKWKFVNQFFITRDVDKVSFDRPDFMNRAAIPYLLTLYTESKYHEEAFQILRDFIRMRKGIPMKAEIIYHGLYIGKFSPKHQWDLIQVGLDEYDNLPVNIFVEKLVSKIALNDESDEYQSKAIDALISWSKNSKYKKHSAFGTINFDLTFQLLNNSKTFVVGISDLKTKIQSDEFINSSEPHDSWDAAHALAIVITKNFEKGLEILGNIESNESLTVNQQYLLFRSFENLENDNTDMLLEIFKSFINPLLDKYPNKEVFETRFYDSYAREGLVKFAEHLAKSQLFDQSLIILKRLVDDTDPSLKEHQENLFEQNLHQKVIEGEDVLTITSVRGNVAWVLRYFALLPAKKYFSKALPLLRKLCKDMNYYVRVQATYPLTEFMKNRDTYVIKNEKKQRFVDEDTSNEVVDIAFAMLRNKENQNLPAVLRGLTYVFSAFRYMNQDQALEVMRILLSSDFENVIRNASSLLVYFAEFRSKSYKKWPWGKLRDFDDTHIKELLLQQIKSGKHNIRQSLSWEFWQLPKDGQKNIENYNKDLFKTSFGYYEEFVKHDYEKDIWGNIYHFIKDYLEFEFEFCIDLWKSCVLKERPYLTKAIKDRSKVQDLSWRPFFHNGKVLVAILNNLGEAEFVKWMEYLLDYPQELLIAYDIEVAVSELSSLPKSVKGIEIVFDKLVKRYPQYFDIRVEWLNKNN